jgi:deoxyribonuclease IV
MPFLGAHLSIAGGLPKAVERAEAAGCEALQIFTKSVGQWKARVIDDSEVAQFRDAVARSSLRAVVAHASYLSNIASPNPALRDQSLAALGEELDRCERLGLLGLVMHPGTATEEEGLPRIADGLTQLLAARPRSKTMILLEHTAGQGNNLGHRFEHLHTILSLMPAHLPVQSPAQSPAKSRVSGRAPIRDRVGVCLDTCHLIASGYDISTAAGYRETFEHFDRLIGLDRLKVMHLNDSKRPCGSRVDRHEHIGKGCLGLDAFERLLNDRRFAELPMVIETEKSDDKGLVDPLDAMNLAALRGLMRKRARSRPIQATRP